MPNHPGLRAAAEDALGMIEKSSGSRAGARAAYESAAQPSASYVVPRRYTRVPLEYRSGPTLKAHKRVWCE